MAVSPLRRLAGRVIPEPIKALRRGWAAAAKRHAERAALERAARQGITPPQSMWAMVGAAENFTEQGRAFSSYLVEKGRLTPGSSVLDVGCGLGKYAIHLAPFLNDGGRYEGFDVEWPSVQWCQIAVTPRFPHARFIHTPLKNDMYNRQATASAAAFRFPYADENFDLVFLASVFTHMFAADVANYVSEIARVLKPGGRCVATFYLLNEEKRAGIAAGTAAFTFAIAHQGSWIETSHLPEAAVAHEETAALAIFGAVGLTLAEPVRYGAWAAEGWQDQDFVIVEKPR
jgi:SAM-dependent methyltransferase